MAAIISNQEVPTVSEDLSLMGEDRLSNFKRPGRYSRLLRQRPHSLLGLARLGLVRLPGNLSLGHRRKEFIDDTDEVRRGGCSSAPP